MNNYFELLVLRFIKLWIEIKLMGWRADDAHQLHKEVSAAISPKAEAAMIDENSR